MAAPPSKRILIVEDEPDLRDKLKGLLTKYQAFQILEAADARQAQDIVQEPGQRLAAVILDIMLSYGTPSPNLGQDNDPDMVDTGVRLLQWLRETVQDRSVWVAVTTSRVNPRLVSRVRSLLGRRGKIYPKPYNRLLLEHDLALVLGEGSQVPAVLIPVDYSPPSHESE
ncbi:MAG: hypothetical protein AB1634_02375 [Thermodesulfobacteriota bacterium]